MTVLGVTGSRSGSRRRSSPVPRWGTPRDPGAATLGPRVAAIAAMLGQPRQPWQRHVDDVVMEVDPATGLLRYRTYVIIVGRQQGKTTWVKPKLAHRALGFGRAQNTVYTTQTADKAREKWRFDQVESFQRSPLAEMIADVQVGLNKERLTWKNGSVHKPVTPSQKTGGTGDSLDEAVVDEAWVHEDGSVESALRPTMITRAQPQFGVVSTAKRQPEGEHSPRFAAWLRRLQREGRARVEAGLPSDVAFFDFSAPADADPLDPETWWGCLPALGHTVSVEAIAADFAVMDLADAAAEYLGIWPDDASRRWQVIGEGVWNDDLADRGLSPGYPLAFAVDTTPEDRGWTAVGSAGPALGGQRMCVEVVERRPGTDWAVPYLVERVDRWRPCAVVINPASAAGSLVKPLRNALKAADLDPEVVKTPTIREVCEAYGQFYDAATDSKHLRHAGQGELDVAVAVAQKRRVGQGLWTWDWSAGDVTSLVAVTNAAWGSTVYGPGHVANDYDVLKSFY